MKWVIGSMHILLFIEEFNYHYQIRSFMIMMMVILLLYYTTLLLRYSGKVAKYDFWSLQKMQKISAIANEQLYHFTKGNNESCNMLVHILWMIVYWKNNSRINACPTEGLGLCDPLHLSKMASTILTYFCVLIKRKYMNLYHEQWMKHTVMEFMFKAQIFPRLSFVWMEG